MSAQVRLQKFLASTGLASRRKCEEYISAGRVEVNGHKVAILGTKIDPEKDIVTVDGKPVLGVSKPRTYILLYKPRNVLSTCKDSYGRAKVTDLVSCVGVPLYPVGRLDYDAEGLILLTNDGRFAYEVTHPRFGIEKTYHVAVKGIPDAKDIEILRNGIMLENGLTAPARARVLSTTGDRAEIEIVIHEGRKRQVKRMLKAVGHPVIRLKRVAIGDVSLGHLRPGEFRHLRADEVRGLLRSQREGDQRDRRFQNTQISDRVSRSKRTEVTLCNARRDNQWRHH